MGTVFYKDVLHIPNIWNRTIIRMYEYSMYTTVARIRMANTDYFVTQIRTRISDLVYTVAFFRKGFSYPYSSHIQNVYLFARYTHTVAEKCANILHSNPSHPVFLLQSMQKRRRRVSEACTLHIQAKKEPLRSRFEDVSRWRGRRWKREGRCDPSSSLLSKKASWEIELGSWSRAVVNNFRNNREDEEEEEEERDPLERLRCKHSRRLSFLQCKNPPKNLKSILVLFLLVMMPDWQVEADGFYKKSNKKAQQILFPIAFQLEIFLSLPTFFLSLLLLSAPPTQSVGSLRCFWFLGLGRLLAWLALALAIPWLTSLSSPPLRVYFGGGRIRGGCFELITWQRTLQERRRRRRRRRAFRDGSKWRLRRIG